MDVCRRHLAPAAYPLRSRGLLRFIGLWLQGHRCLFDISVDQPCRERQTVSLTAESKTGKITEVVKFVRFCGRKKKTPQSLYLVNTGSNQYFFWSPNTWTMFFRKPREKPFLSEPVLKTGALKASVKQDRHRQRRQKFSLYTARFSQTNSCSIAFFYLWWTCFFQRATDGSWTGTKYWCRTSPPQKTGTRRGIWRECPAARSDARDGERTTKKKKEEEIGDKFSILKVIYGTKRKKTKRGTYKTDTDNGEEKTEGRVLLMPHDCNTHHEHDNQTWLMVSWSKTKGFRRPAGLPLGSSLPISSGKALVQTETRAVSDTRREQVEREEAYQNQ